MSARSLCPDMTGFYSITIFRTRAVARNTESVSSRGSSTAETQSQKIPFGDKQTALETASASRGHSSLRRSKLRALP
jgi:hypothetical protein